MHALEQPFVRARRSVQARQEFAVSFPSHSENAAIQQRIFGCAAGRIQHKIRAILAGQLRGAIDQLAHLRLDTDVERFAFRRDPIGTGHKDTRQPG